MWYIFADYPAGPSANYSIFELEEMKHTPLHQFKDNVAHSNGQAGLALFKRLGPNHEILPCSTYAPNYNPTDLKGGPPFAPVVFDGFIGEKIIHAARSHKALQKIASCLLKHKQSTFMA